MALVRGDGTIPGPMSRDPIATWCWSSVLRSAAGSFAAHYGIETVYGSVEELLAREVPDVVSAILPVAHTHDVVIACAEAGVKVVSCEKPIDYDLARADETVRVCQERGTLFGCGTAMWMWPYIPQASAWIQAEGVPFAGVDAVGGGFGSRMG